MRPNCASIAQHHPLGTEGEPWPWKSELSGCPLGDLASPGFGRGRRLRKRGHWPDVLTRRRSAWNPVVQSPDNSPKISWPSTVRPSPSRHTARTTPEQIWDGGVDIHAPASAREPKCWTVGAPHVRLRLGCAAHGNRCLMAWRFLRHAAGIQDHERHVTISPVTSPAQKMASFLCTYPYPRSGLKLSAQKDRPIAIVLRIVQASTTVIEYAWRSAAFRRPATITHDGANICTSDPPREAAASANEYEILVLCGHGDSFRLR